MNIINYNKVIDCILNDQSVNKATKYVSPKLIVRAVRKTYKVNGRKARKGENVEIHLTIGRPNYIEREFIKLCKEASEPFPVKMVQLKRNFKKKVKLIRKNK